MKTAPVPPPDLCYNTGRVRQQPLIGSPAVATENPRVSSGKSYRGLCWSLLSVLIVVGIVFLIWKALDFDLLSDAQVHDTLSVSPDGAYIAAVRDINTGAVGSSSCIVLKSAHDQFPKFGFGKGVVAGGPYGSFGPATWLGPRTLQVMGGGGKTIPGWKTQWRDVRIVYK
jgi:hypothetical protein